MLARGAGDGDPQVSFGNLVQTESHLKHLEHPTPSELHERYEDWVEQADRMVALFQSQGMRVEEVVAWCKASGRPFDSKARAEYTSETLRKRDLPGAS